MINMTMMIGLTITSYLAGLLVFKVTNRFPFFHPIITASLLVIGGLRFFDVSPDTYQSGNQITYYCLSIATVSLGVPLYNQLDSLRRYSWSVLIPIVFGGIVAPTLAWLTVYWLDTPLNIQMTMLVKSITTPLAIEASKLIGGSPRFFNISFNI